MSSSESYRILFLNPRGGPLEWTATRPPDPVVVAFEQPDCQVRLYLSMAHHGFETRRIDVIAHEGGEAVGSVTLRNLKLGRLQQIATRVIAHTSAEAQHDRSGRPWAAAIEWTQDDDRPVLSAVFDQLGLPAPDTTGSKPVAGAGTASAMREHGMTSSTSVQAIAAVFRFATANGWPGNTYVSDFFGIPRSTATVWVKAARDAGALEPATRKRRSDTYQGGRRG